MSEREKEKIRRKGRGREEEEGEEGRRRERRRWKEGADKKEEKLPIRWSSAIPLQPLMLSPAGLTVWRFT